jgi:hypothetical protein
MKGENIPNMYTEHSRKPVLTSLISSPCLRQDCLTFMAFIRNYNSYEYKVIYNTLTSQQKLL